MRKITGKLLYHGTACRGWQVQRNAVAVCETLQNALAKITGAPVHLTGCGWTDVSSMYCAARTGISRRCAWAGPS